jgi:hypothetical protein
MLMEPDLALAPPLLEDPMPPVPPPPVLLVLMESLSGVILLI